jgi:predicted alpha/beta-fold hydrolase
MTDITSGPVGMFPAFRPRAPWFGPHLQTVRNTLRQPRHPLQAGRVLEFPMPDGSGDRLLGCLNRPPSPTDKPLCLLLHGLTGSEDSYYMRATAAMLLADGFPVLRLNLRGAGPSAGHCRQRYHAGRTGDIRAVLAGLPVELVARGTVIIGYSLGGNATLKLLGEADFPVTVLAGASISAPIDLAASSRHMMAPANRFYHRWLLGKMKAEMALATDLVEAQWRDAAATAISLWDFDNRLVGPWNGWSGAAEYYAVNSANRFLPGIAVPTLLIHALDDPWIPGDAYQAVDWAALPMLTPLLSPGGGHVGFHGRGGIWSDQCLRLFLRRLFA